MPSMFNCKAKLFTVLCCFFPSHDTCMLTYLIIIFAINHDHYNRYKLKGELMIIIILIKLLHVPLNTC